MKNLNYLWLAGGLFLLGSCSSEAPNQGENGPDVSGEDCYLKISLGSLSTRGADTYKTDIENAAFIFFDENERYISTRYVTTGTLTDDQKTANAGVDIKWLADQDGHTADKCAVIKLSRIPTYVACVVNAEDSRTFTSKNDLDTKDVQNSFAKSGGNLYMSSSTYYDTNRDDDGAVYWSVIDKGAIKSGETGEADAIGSEAAVRLKVEPLVAKVEVKNGLELTDGAINPMAGSKADQVSEYTVSFTPESVLLTSVATKGYTMKRLGKYSDLTGNQPSLNDMANQRINLVGNSFPTGNTFKKYKKSELTANAYPATGSQFFFPFDNFGPTAVNTTNVVVLGKYTLTKGTEEIKDQTFYLLATGSKFTVHTNEADLITKMGGTPGTDTLVEERTGSAHDTWTGWMKLSTTDTPFRCIKYDGGYGYYAAPIHTANADEMIVRNTHYELTIKTINGMGVGLPDDVEIIPVTPPDPNQTTYYMHIGVEVLPWIKSTYNVEWK